MKNAQPQPGQPARHRRKDVATGAQILVGVIQAVVVEAPQAVAATRAAAAALQQEVAAIQQADQAGPRPELKHLLR